MNKTRKSFITNKLLVFLLLLNMQIIYAQQVEVQGELKVSDMTANDTEENLVTRNTDGTLGTRSVSSLPPPPPPIDTTRNLASDFELAKQLCQCQNIPPFLIKKLIDSGYTQEELMASGIPVKSVLDAQRVGILLDTRDNQTYKTVTIGAQTWMAENLNYGNIVSGYDAQTDNSIIEKYCYDDNAANCTTYGGLYLWDEMMQYVSIESTQGICPTGWHLPSDTEWQILEMALGMTQVQAETEGSRGTDQGSQLAENEFLWSNSGIKQNAAFGSSGFAALPGGKLLTLGTFNDQTINTIFWTSTENGVNKSWYRTFYSPLVYRGDVYQEVGMSVRCVKD